MSTKFLELEDNFRKNKSILDNARETLKVEFFGIDSVIDEIITNMSSWLIFNEIQEKPLVINLWGLTGVGKTALISRLAELINFKDVFFRFDLGKKQGSFSFSSALDDLCENKDTSPLIIALDEFQHARTLDENRNEIKNDENRMVWELIDSGEVQYISWKNGLWSFDEYISKLYYLLQAGVIVENGLVVNKRQLFSYEDGVSFDEDVDILFVEEKMYSRIIEYAGEELYLNLNTDVQNALLKMNGDETIHFLNKVLKIGKRPTVKNFSKAMIFILGNLDEAYTMGSNFSADINADEFYRQSLEITVPKIKNSLKERFRDEQIARFGNIHIIYPALSKFAYQSIINKELNKISSKLFLQTDLTFLFDSSVNELIYKEGVYPTQGVRPIFTTINQIVKGNITTFLLEIFNSEIPIQKLKFWAEGSELVCDYIFEKEVVSAKRVKVVTNLEDIRKVKKDDFQTITAVHESGHAVLASVLLSSIPEVVCSNTTDVDSSGFVYTRMNHDYISKKEIILRVAMMLGGYIAEEIIFGKEHITAGAGGDIEKATEFLSSMILSSGMGDLPIKYNIPLVPTMHSYHKVEDAEELIKQSIVEAMDLAKQTLLKEKKLLLAMADYLSDKRVLKKEEIRQLIKEHASENLEFAEGDTYYRKHLKRMVKEKEPIGNFSFHPPIILNKETNTK